MDLTSFLKAPAQVTAPADNGSAGWDEFRSQISQQLRTVDRVPLWNEEADELAYVSLTFSGRIDQRKRPNGALKQIFKVAMEDGEGLVWNETDFDKEEDAIEFLKGEADSYSLSAEHRMLCSASTSSRLSKGGRAEGI